MRSRAVFLFLFALAFRAAAGALPSPVPTAPTVVEPKEPRWSFQVDARDLAHGMLSIEMKLYGFSGPLPICADRTGAGRSVRHLRAMPADTGNKDVSASNKDVATGNKDASTGKIDASTSKTDGQLLLAEKDRADCFSAVAPAKGPLVLRYGLDLADLSRHHGDPDWATRSGDDYVFNEEAVLLRPDPLPDDAPIEIDFVLPEGISIAGPWKPLDRAGSRFASDSAQFDGGSYVALGKLRQLATFDSHGGRFDVIILSGAHKASDAALIKWVKPAALAVADFYRGVPTGRAMVTLVPVPGESEGGIFGSTRHRAQPSSVLFFGADAGDNDFADDWLPSHELFHIGNPRTWVRWFNEGSATYYQDVLRGRAGMESPVWVWSDLYDGFHKHCPKDGGTPLAEGSKQMNVRHNFGDIYWGGACVFFRVDVLIREHSHGKRGLGDLLRALLKRSEEGEELEEPDLIDALDEAAGSTQPKEMIEESKLPPIEPIYQRLGIEPVSSDQVKLNDAAPEASYRRQILEEKSPAK